MKLFSKILLAYCLLFALSLNVSAQVGNPGGPIVDIELQEVCDDSTVAFQVLQFVVGSATPTLLGYVDAAGAAYTLTGTPTAGSCAGGSAPPDYTVSVLSLCDSGTPFYRVAVFTDSTFTATATADFELDLSTSYTVVGTVYTGPCATTATAAITRTISTSTGTITAGAFSFEICNEGTSNGTVTVGGGSAAALIPGSCIWFRSNYNPSTRQYRVAPAVAYVATGTSFAVVVEN